jgi:hypothetical protein
MYKKGKIVQFLEQQQESLGKSFRVFNFKQCMPRNLGNAYSFLTIRGHRATILKTYFDYFSGALSNPLDSKLDVLGVKYVVSPGPIEGLNLVMRENDRYLYERRDSLTLVHWFDPASGERRPAIVEKIQFSANSVRLRLGETSEGLLIFSQPCFPGWRVTVEEAKRDIRQTEIFMGVQLKAGEKELAFYYRPWLIWLGLTGTLMSMAALAISCRIKQTTTPASVRGS